ncbi:MAG: CaiB/BaiF CoA-transferase family protein [Rhodocyclaceae bacterium]
MSSSSPRPKPLAGVRVLDLSRLLPGPMASLQLADLGADVIKIEDPGAGDYARSMGARPGETSALFRLLNRNKRALRLDLKRPEGVAVLLRLARDAHVLIEGFRPGAMERLGLGYARLASEVPRLVYCSISGYGADGPWALRAGHDINYIGLAGVLDQIGAAGGPPVVPNFQIGDLLGGAAAAVGGILAALLDARSSGRGRHVDVSMTDAVLSQAVFAAAGLLLRGASPPRGGDLLSGGVPCYGVYETADGRHLAVGALERKFWSRLCAILGRPDLEVFHLESGERGAFARAELAALFRARPLAHWTELFEREDCCVSPVLTIEEALAQPHFRQRGTVFEAHGATQLGPPLRMSEFEHEAGRPAPAAGADSETILIEAGYSKGEIVRLRELGVL